MNMKKWFALLAVLCLLGRAAGACAETQGSDYLSDFDEALRITEEYNPFIPIIRSNAGNYDELCAHERELVQTRCRSAEDLMMILADLFARIGNPGHLAMINAASYREYQYILEQGLYGENSPEDLLINDPLTRATYGELQYKPSATADWSNSYPPYVTYDEGRNLLYIRMLSFRHELIERDRNVFIDALRAHPETKHIVFDICGNGGGSDYYWSDLLVAPFGEPVSYEKRVFFRDNDLMRRYGYMEGAVPVSELDREDVPAFVEELGLTHMLSGRIVIEPAEEGRIIRSDAQRWVLIDEYVFSAADGFAGFCKQTGWATLVGRTTMGDGGSSAPVLARLPKTGLLMRFSAMASANQENQLNTFYGTNPDYPSKPFEHVYDTVLRVIDAK